MVGVVREWGKKDTAHYLPIGWRILAPYLAFSHIISLGYGGTLIWGKVGSLGSPLSLCCYECCLGSSFFLWCLAGEEKLVKFSVFLGYPFPDGAGVYWDFFVCAHWHFQSAASPGYIFETKKQSKTPETYHCFVIWALRSLADFSSSLHICILFVLYIISKVFSF